MRGGGWARASNHLNQTSHNFKFLVILPNRIFGDDCKVDFIQRVEGEKSYSDKESRQVIAVTMATSRQGVSIIKHLSKLGKFRIKAMTRNPSSEKAKQIGKISGVELLQGDLLKKQSLLKCFKGCYGIFGNTTPTKGWMCFRGSMVHNYELEQGRNLVEAVEETRKQGILKHFIFSSICKAKDPLTRVSAPGHFLNKWNIEDFIEIKGLKDITTILRPVSYFENFYSNIPGLRISNQAFPGVVKGNKPWQTIAVDDIGLWSAAAFNNPRKFLNKQLNLAGEEMTGEEMADLLNSLKNIEGRRIPYFMIPRVVMKLIEHDIAIMAQWIESAGYGADIKTLKVLANEIGITMTPLSLWLKKRAVETQINTSSKPLSLDLATLDTVN